MSEKCRSCLNKKVTCDYKSVSLIFFYLGDKTKLILNQICFIKVSKPEHAETCGTIQQFDYQASSVKYGVFEVGKETGVDQVMKMPSNTVSQ